MPPLSVPLPEAPPVAPWSAASFARSGLSALPEDAATAWNADDLDEDRELDDAIGVGIEGAADEDDALDDDDFDDDDEEEDDDDLDDDEEDLDDDQDEEGDDEDDLDDELLDLDDEYDDFEDDVDRPGRPIDD